MMVLGELVLEVGVRIWSIRYALSLLTCWGRYWFTFFLEGIYRAHRGRRFYLIRDPSLFVSLLNCHSDYLWHSYFCSGTLGLLTPEPAALIGKNDSRKRQLTFSSVLTPFALFFCRGTNRYWGIGSCCFRKYVSQLVEGET